MIPSANTVARETPPPANRSYKLNRVPWPAHQSGAEQRLRRDLDTLGQLSQVTDVHHLRGLLKRVREAALRDAADERHLAALEPRPGLAARARGLTFAPPAGGLADPRAGAAPLADAGTVRAHGGPQAVQHHPLRRDRLRFGPRPRLRLRFRPAPQPPPPPPPPPPRRLRLPLDRRHSPTSLPSRASP